MPSPSVSHDFYRVRGTSIAAAPSDLIARIRDQAIVRLHETGGLDPTLVEHTLMGHRPGPAHPPAKGAARVQMAMVADAMEADVLVLVPETLPRQFRYVFSALPLGTGAYLECCSPPSGLAATYGLPPAMPSQIWQSCTPVALPGPTQTPSGRSDPDTLRRSVQNALRHASVDARVVWARAQRDGPAGHLALEHYACQRFTAERLCHLQIELARPMAGPLLLGDGRYVGLGLMRPEPGVRRWGVIYSATIQTGLAPSADALVITRALRRAVLSRAQRTLGHGTRLPALVSGHAPDGSPASGHNHLHYLFDAPRRRVLLVGPATSRYAADTDLVRRSLLGFRELRAGSAGRLRLCSVATDLVHDSLLGYAFHWRTLTPYTVNAHRRCTDARRAVEEDLRSTCCTAGLPVPQVAVGRVHRSPAGLTADLELRFGEPVPGPLLLGRTRHRGGGLFVGGME